MHRGESSKYLGDIFHNSGKSKYNIIDRSAKAYGILAEIRAILNDVPLGKYRVEAGLSLRQAMFINGVLYNSEVWQGLESTDLTMLQNVDHQLMRVICHNAHSKTPIEFLYLETAAHPIKYILSSRRIMYLQNILTREKEELIRRVYEAQKSNPTHGDFICLVKRDLEDINEPFDEEKIASLSKLQLKTHIRKKIGQLVFNDLKLKQDTHSKIRDIKYSQFKIQPYLKSNTFTTEMAGLLFNLRSSMTKNIKQNFSSFYQQNLKCKMNCNDPNAIDSQCHLLNCTVLSKLLSEEESIRAKGVKYEDIFGSLKEQREAVVILARILKVREDSMEEDSLPVGINTGPDSAVVSAVLVK